MHLAVARQDAVFHIGAFAFGVELVGQRQHRAVFGQQGIGKRCRIGVQALATAAPDLFIAGADVEHGVGLHVHVVEHVVDVFGQLAKARFAANQRHLRTRALQRNAGQAHARGNQLLVHGLGSAGRLAVNCKGGQHLATVGNHRRAPAGAQIVGQQQRPVVLHQRVSRHILNHHRLLAKGSGAAGAPALANGQAVNGLDKVWRQADAHPVAQQHATHLQDGAPVARRALIDQLHNGLERVGQRRALGNQAQHLILGQRKVFGSLGPGDVAENSRAAYELTARVIQRPGADL